MSLFRLKGFAEKLNHFRKYLMFGKRYDTQSYIKELCARGAKIDKSLYMPTPESVFLDGVTASPAARALCVKMSALRPESRCSRTTQAGMWTTLLPAE